MFSEALCCLEHDESKLECNTDLSQLIPKCRSASDVQHDERLRAALSDTGSRNMVTTLVMHHALNAAAREQLLMCPQQAYTVLSNRTDQPPAVAHLQFASLLMKYDTLRMETMVQAPG
jgi:hypothetical protein